MVFLSFAAAAARRACRDGEILADFSP